jgi:hypothetical protein
MNTELFSNAMNELSDKYINEALSVDNLVIQASKSRHNLRLHENITDKSIIDKCITHKFKQISLLTKFAACLCLIVISAGIIGVLHFNIRSNPIADSDVSNSHVNNSGINNSGANNSDISNSGADNSDIKSSDINNSYNSGSNNNTNPLSEPQAAEGSSGDLIPMIYVHGQVYRMYYMVNGEFQAIPLEIVNASNEFIYLGKVQSSVSSGKYPEHELEVNEDGDGIGNKVYQYRDYIIIVPNEPAISPDGTYEPYLLYVSPELYQGLHIY